MTYHADLPDIAGRPVVPCDLWDRKLVIGEHADVFPFFVELFLSANDQHNPSIHSPGARAMNV